MKRFAFDIRRWFSKKCGATAIEYALIAAGIAMAIVIIIFTLGDTVLNDLFTPVANALTGA